MVKTTTVLGCILFLAAGFLAADPSKPSADDIARILLESKDYREASSRLKELDSEMLDPTWALEPLLSRVVAGTDASDHLAAVCHADAWSDGAWWLEIGQAAYDAVTAAPGEFANRYLEGNECALLMLVYALEWPAKSLDVVVDCESDLDTAFAIADRDLTSIKDRVWSLADLHASNPRHRVLFMIVNQYAENWPTERDSYLKWCEKERGQSD
jgi:hypothetical protein